MARITDNTKGFMEGMDDEIQKKLLKSAKVVERTAKQLCPVKTGRLRRSIAHEVEKNRAVVGTNVEYAKFQELGTSKMAAHPFLRPALHGNLDKIKSIFNEEK